MERHCGTCAHFGIVEYSRTKCVECMNQPQGRHPNWEAQHTDKWVADNHDALTFHQLPAVEGGLKFDSGKPPMALLDRYAMEQIALVLAFGAQKYAAHNWRKGIAYSRLLDAALRHLFAFADGEDNDPESGLSHIAHAGCCIVFLLGMINARPDQDDRHTCAKP